MNPHPHPRPPMPLSRRRKGADDARVGNIASLWLIDLTGPVICTVTLLNTEINSSVEAEQSFTVVAK